MTRTPKQELLVNGVYDWTDEAWAAGAAWDVATTLESRRQLALGLIAELIVEGLMVPGSVDRDGHHPWPLSPGEAIERITREWLLNWSDELPTPGSIVWLASTTEGKRLGREILAAEDGAEPPGS